jgi:hypothetical protein
MWEASFPPSPVECSSHHHFYKISHSCCWADAATPAFFSRLVYLQFLWEVPLPCSPVEFSSHCHFYKISCSKIAGQVQPLLPSLIGLFIYSSVRDCPFPPLWCSGHPILFATCLFVVVVIQFVFFLFFSWVGVSLSKGLCWSGPRFAVRVPHAAYLTWRSASLKPVGNGIWQHGSPPGLSIYKEVGMLCAAWECGGVRGLPLLGGFSCKVYLQCHPRFYFGSMLSASSLCSPSWNLPISSFLRSLHIVFYSDCTTYIISIYLFIIYLSHLSIVFCLSIHIVLYEDSIIKLTKHHLKKREGSGGSGEYNRGAELVQCALHTSIEFSQLNPLMLLIYAS